MKILNFILTKLKKNSFYEYGICNGRKARRHIIKKNVQFILFYKGDQKYVDGIGHKKDKWVNFDSSWWDGFVKNKEAAAVITFSNGARIWTTNQETIKEFKKLR